MRVFVTGGAGFVGRAVVQELRSHGHSVLALARSDASTESLCNAGAEPHRGDLEDRESLVRGAQAADGVIHLAFVHDVDAHTRATAIDRAAVEALATAVAGTDKPLVIATGTLMMRWGALATEDGPFTTTGPQRLRVATPQLLQKMSETHSVRGIEVRLSPAVHDTEDWGYVPHFMTTARTHGYVAYVGEGRNVWPAVHRRDAAALFRRALEQGAAGASYHAVAEERIATRDIMAAIGRRLNLSTKSISQDEAHAALGFLAFGLSADNPTSSAWTQRQLGWTPVQIGLLEDIETNYPVDV